MSLNLKEYEIKLYLKLHLESWRKPTRWGDPVGCMKKSFI